MAKKKATKKTSKKAEKAEKKAPVVCTKLILTREGNHIQIAKGRYSDGSQVERKGFSLGTSTQKSTAVNAILDILKL